MLQDRNSFQRYIEAKSLAKFDLLTYIKSNNSLDKRWERFKKEGEELLSTKPWKYSFKSFNKPEFKSTYRNKLEDFFYENKERYETITFNSVIEFFEETKEEILEGQYTEIFEEDFNIDSLIIELKEEFLTGESFGFEYDW